MGQLREALPNLHLVVAGHDAGNGHGRRVRELTRSHSVSDRVHFVGEVRGEEKPRTLFGADAFVLSSYTEGLPVAAIEAMAARLPVILTPGCNLPEVKKAGAGVIVSPSPRAVAAGIRKVFESESDLQRMGQNARGLVERKFTWDRIARRMLRAYGRVLGWDDSSLVDPRANEVSASAV